ncbi:hypothetical protein L0P88_04120 [Muricauda sp. SCSIO 64092]|uniref:hypothetical protein n=1 Tax=Allomuricauda sp. SCSIO 64092 TaxID=2908842 RepID=UPI001FF0E575|nr:hypothetical protein [Muricauda sp. SCSIO 64092]UOY07741.1 hypothetical protein L0P88_04120 [Muricauda sp. SCSIO 64092]
MTPKDFCNHHGFRLVPKEQDNGRYLINVTDERCTLYPSGTRVGTVPIHPAILEPWLQKCYNELMDFILDKQYN